MSRSTTVLSLLMLALPLPAAAQDRPPRNLQVLPDTLSRAEVIARMRDIASALGVSCNHCHAELEGGRPGELDHAVDALPTKEIAREMMRMTARINDELLPAALEDAATGLTVRCLTCHRGAPRPVMLEDTLRTVIVTVGVDSAIATYARLRTRYRDRFTYDFGERALTDLGSTLAAEGRLPEARRMLELNAEAYPDSWNVAYELGRVYEALGERDLAIAQYRKAVTIQPRATHVQTRLEALIGS
jgi:tetratricopeptide (TPR) repeat protein